MSTMVCWFASEMQARQAVLDLLTGGIPRQDISVVINASPGEQDGAAIQSSGAAGGQPDGNSHPRDFVAALAGPGALTLTDIGRVVAAGPLANRLVPTGAGTAGELRGALIAAGIAEEQAQIYAEQLRRGGALLAVRSDGSWDTIVAGVFRHNASPSLREQEEPVGPTPEPEVAADEVGGQISGSIGALTGGALPGAWGAAGAIFEDQAEDSAADEKRRS